MCIRDSNNDELNQIKEAIKEEEKLQPTEEVKPKPKRKPAQKKIKEVVVVEESSKESPPIKGADKTEQSSVESPKEEQLPSGVLGSTNESPKDESLKNEPPQETPKKTKTIEQVECPKCHKLMSRRTLRYDHDKTCPGEKIDREKIPVKKRIKKEVMKHIDTSTVLNVPEEIIEQLPQGVLGRDVEHLVELEVKKRIQNTVNEKINQRIKQKEEKIKKLAAQIV